MTMRPPRALNGCTGDPYRKPGRPLSIREVGSAPPEVRPQSLHAQRFPLHRQIDPPRQIDPSLATLHGSHTLARHTSVQNTPHTPQLSGSAESAVSHPSPSSPLQSPKCASQVAMWHWPLVHRVVALGKRHPLPHPPQCATSLRVSTSQPSSGEPLQLAYDGAHDATSQRPSSQTGVAWAGAHALPQAPQLARVMLVFTSQPLSSRPSQSAEPASQRPMRHTPAAHCAVALARSHTRPHAPQLAGLLEVSTSHPLVASPSQSAKPAAQPPKAHTPSRHTPTALGQAQRTGQVPQWSALARRSTSQPLLASPSQSP